ncbi:MAG: cbb3-type cytochrome c oxidase subunit II [Gemmatimonadaceae bacterium]
MTRAWLLLLGALATLGFAVTVLIVVPRVMLSGISAPPALAQYSAQEQRGRAVYVANGCVYCHSQQVRDPAFTTDIDRGWGIRATVPGDYAYDRPHLLGTMRTGPDLINVGQRLPDPAWHLVHLYNPRAVTPWSIMPAFPFLFELADTGATPPAQGVVAVPPAFVPQGKRVLATEDALALTAYLQSLKRSFPVPASAFVTDQHRGAASHAAEKMP